VDCQNEDAVVRRTSNFLKHSGSGCTREETENYYVLSNTGRQLSRSAATVVISNEKV